MSEHPIAERIIHLLDEQQCWYETFSHAPVRTSEEAAQVRTGYSLAQGAKALIVKAKSANGSAFSMLVVPGNNKFDGTKVKRLLGSKDLRFASEDEVVRITQGVKPGGVPPFGGLFGLTVFADPTLFSQATIIFNAGRDCSIAMRSTDYRTLAHPEVVPIV